MKLDVHFLPELVEPGALAGVCVVVIDVLRATTTIVTALAHGAEAIIPCLTVEEARQQAHRAGQAALLGGERGGRKIEQFDLGNSPLEYTPARVSGKLVFFTTTNGTKALHHAAHADEVVIAAFANFSTVCDYLAHRSQVQILCAGTGGTITREDVLLAGALVADRQAADERAVTNDQGQLAREAWQDAARGLADGRPLAEALRSSQGARDLTQIGQERDIEIAAQIDRFAVLPIFDRRSGRVCLR